MGGGQQGNGRFPQGFLECTHIENQFGKDFPGTASEVWALFHGGIYFQPKLIQLELSERLGEQGKEFLEWSVEGMKSYACLHCWK